MTTDPRGEQPAVERAIAALIARPRPVLLQCAVQHYAWGGYDLIPSLLGRENPERQPFAELWIGAHPTAPSVASIDGVDAPLDLVASRAPHLHLPFLLKLLDVRVMLSIQAHPDARQAEIGFARETAAGVPLAAPHRTYKDTSHKPELATALTDFWVLLGFQPFAQMRDTLDRVPELRELAAVLNARAAETADAAAWRAAVRSLVEHVARMPQPAVDRLLAPLVSRLLPAYERGRLPRESADYWAARAAAWLPLPGGHLDRGIVSIYLLNLLRLQPGQAVYIPAGVPHAYLEGAAVEVMASSDNVVRGGLTPKHVDVEELLDILTFELGPAVPLEPDLASADERVFRTPAREFELARLDLSAGRTHRSLPRRTPDVLMVLEGEAVLEAGSVALSIKRGQVVLVPPGLACALQASHKATIFRVSVPAEAAAGAVRPPGA